MNRVPLLALAMLLSLVAGPAPWAHDREVREPREPREARDREREERDREGRDREERDERQKDSGDDSGRGHGRGGESSGRRSGHDADRRDRRQRLELEHDRRGGERVRGEAVIVGSREELDAIAAAGFGLIERSQLRALGAEIARVRAPAGSSVDAFIERLRALAPASEITAQHVYRSSGASTESGVAKSAPDGAGPPVDALDEGSRSIRLGVVDTGAAAATPALRRALRAQRGFTPAGYLPRDHGTAVAGIAAGYGLDILSADVFGTDDDGQPAATAVSLALALDWLLAEGVRVINISVEGPDNPVFARMIRRAIEDDVAIVAAAGNQGPWAPPSYPAAYVGVIAVTAIDARGRPYRRAGRGAHVTFAARGVDVPVTGIDGRPRRVSGTSFAAPEVAGRVAQLRRVDPALPAARLVDALRSRARDLGDPGRDPVYGWGELTTGAALNAGAR